MEINLMHRTNIGKLIVEDSGWSSEGYLGFRVSMERNGKLTSVALIEVDQSEPDVEPVLKVHVYDPQCDEPISHHYMKKELF